MHLGSVPTHLAKLSKHAPNNTFPPLCTQLKSLKLSGPVISYRINSNASGNEPDAFVGFGEDDRPKDHRTEGRVYERATIGPQLHD